MFQNILTVVSVLLIVYIVYKVGFLVWNKYYKSSSLLDTFKTSVPQPSVVPPPVVTQAPPELPRVVSPSGPNPPNAAAPANQVVVIPEERPNDPYDQAESNVPIKDNMRNPERSFGPNVDNSGVQRSVVAGTASNAISTSVSSFSPEFAQNGGDFLEGIKANDFGAGDEYATI